MKLEIIAEIAQGFEGNYEQARLLVKAAAAAGADVAKMQLIYADELATPGYKYYELFKTLEMSDEEWMGLNEYAKSLHIGLSLDIFGMRGLKLCNDISVRTVKLHPTDITNIGLLQAVSETAVEKVYLGAGGAQLSEIEKGLQILKSKNVVLLLGFQAYPTENNANHISRLGVYTEHFRNKYKNVEIGFADHADAASPLRYVLPAMAVAAGATVLEKHLTLGQVMKLEDYESALNPDLFAEFVNIVRESATAMGEPKAQEDFGMDASENQYRLNIRRHVVAGTDFPAGKEIQPEDVVLKRTACEHPIFDLYEVYGKKTTAPVTANNALTTKDFI